MFLTGEAEETSKSNSGAPVVRVAILLGDHGRMLDAVLAVRSRSMRSRAPSRVRRAFEIGALVALLLTVLLAIPLAGTLVAACSGCARRRCSSRSAATSHAFPADRARDEVGDLARSFSIMQRRLRQQEEARRAFVATASHELRTPLASLEGMLELLADDLRPAARIWRTRRAARSRARPVATPRHGWRPTCST